VYLTFPRMTLPRMIVPYTRGAQPARGVPRNTEPVQQRGAQQGDDSGVCSRVEGWFLSLFSSLFSRLVSTLFSHKKSPIAHILSQVLVHAVYVVSVFTDVYRVRQGLVCSVSPLCTPGEENEGRTAACDALGSNIRAMFFAYAVAVGVATLKLLSVTAITLFTHKSAHNPIQPAHNPIQYNWRECYTICTACSVAIALDICLVLVSIWRIVVLPLQISNNAEDIAGADSMNVNWHVAFVMASITTLMILYDAVMLYFSVRTIR
jgi:hypothetical protein